MRKNGELWKIIKIFSITLFILLGIGLFELYSPYPVAWATRWLFGQSTYTNHPHLNQVKEEVEIIRDVEYPSSYNQNKLDIIYPKNNSTPLPVIYWVHGGAFVAGDKDDVTNYMIILANEGYVIVNINYELAPKAKYPAPLIQLGEAYNFIEYSEDYPFIDKDTIYFGGDSAGAHIASQFVLIQTSPSYVDTLSQIKETKDIKKTVTKPI